MWSYQLILLFFLSWLNKSLIIGKQFIPSWDSYDFNCEQAVNNTLEYCNFATWDYARIYQNDSYSVYNYGTPLTTSYQDFLATNFSSAVLSMGHKSKQCSSSLRWFSCLHSFPYCPFKLKSAAYYTPCRIHCQQVNINCRTEFNCHKYLNTNCQAYVPNGYFLLPPSKGPFENLSNIFLIFCIIWIVTLLSWTAHIIRYGAVPSMPALRFIALLLLARLLMSLISLFLWIDCSVYLGFCPKLTDSRSKIFLRLVEAGQMLILLVLSKGWSITRPQLSPIEWSHVFFITFSFLMVSLIVSNLLQPKVSSSWEAFVIIIYVYVFSQILYSCFTEIQILRAQLIRLHPNLPHEIIEPIQDKITTYKIWLILINCLIIIEIISECLFFANIPFINVIIFEESTSYIIILFIAYLLRPRSLSVFYYMIPTRNTLETSFPRHQRPLPIIAIENSVMNTFVASNPSCKQIISELSQSRVNFSLHSSYIQDGLDVDYDEEEIRNSENLATVTDHGSMAQNTMNNHHNNQPPRQIQEMELTPLLSVNSELNNNNNDQTLIAVNREDGLMELGIHNVLMHLNDNRFISRMQSFLESRSSRRFA